MKFIILGAGLSGLTCATTLKKHGHDVCVVEKESEVGGLARSYKIDGHTFDYGPHFLFGEKVYEIICEQFPEIDLKRVDSTKEKMYFREKYFNFPFDPKNIILNLENGKLPGVLCDLIMKRVFGSASSCQSQSVEDWVIQAVGRRIYDYVSLGGYIEKLYGLPPTEISREWGIQKLKFLAKWRDANLIKLALSSLSEENNVRKRVIHYPISGGIDHVAIGISESLKSLGGEILFDSEAATILHRNDGVSLILRTKGREQRVDGDFLISTIPITQLVGMLKPAVPADIGRKVKLLRYRTLLLLYLCIRREWVLKDQCIYFTEEPYLFRRITEFKHLDKGMAPQGMTSLCIEMTCFDNDQIYDKDKEEICRIVVEQLENGGYLKRDDIEGYHFLRIPFAYPVYELKSNSILESVLNYLGGYGNIISIGRQGLFFYNAMNSSIILSHDLANKLSLYNRTRRREIIKAFYHLRLKKYK